MLRVDEAVTVRAVVEGLVPNRNYTFSIAAITSLGEVAATTNTTLRTPDGGKSETRQMLVWSDAPPSWLGGQTQRRLLSPDSSRFVSALVSRDL